MFAPCFVMHYYFAIILTRKKEFLCFICLPGGCYCSVVLPHGVVGWSAVCN